MSNVREKINTTLNEMADEAFDEETAQDSDGLDQAFRSGILAALDAVNEIMDGDDG